MVVVELDMQSPEARADFLFWVMTFEVLRPTCFLGGDRVCLLRIRERTSHIGWYGIEAGHKRIYHTVVLAWKMEDREVAIWLSRCKECREIDLV
jgi:hypothetical protein